MINPMNVFISLSSFSFSHLCMHSCLQPLPITNQVNVVHIIIKDEVKVKHPFRKLRWSQLFLQNETLSQNGALPIELAYWMRVPHAVFLFCLTVIGGLETSSSCLLYKESAWVYSHITLFSFLAYNFILLCFFINLCVYKHIACKYVCAPIVCLIPVEARRGHGLTRTGVTGSCKLQCQCWESKPGSQKEYLLLLTTETTLWPSFF